MDTVYKNGTIKVPIIYFGVYSAWHREIRAVGKITAIMSVLKEEELHC